MCACTLYASLTIAFFLIQSLSCAKTNFIHFIWMLSTYPWMVVRAKSPKTWNCQNFPKPRFYFLRCAHILQIYYINSGCLCVRLSDTTILHFNSSAEPASAFSMAEPACGSWWRPFVTELGSVTEGRPGSARHSRTPGFSPTGPTVGGVGPGSSQKADRV
jgi:hypothetical protein